MVEGNQPDGLHPFRLSAPLTIPRVIDAPAPPHAIAGSWATTPAGVILHGSRSGKDLTVAEEFAGTVSWAEQGAPFTNPDGSVDDLGWNVTIGDGVLANHIGPKLWGWSARKWSYIYLAGEFAQAHEFDPIADASVDAFVWWFLFVGRAAWPNLPAVFPTHAELDRQLAHPDGKTDAFSDGTQLRARIAARLANP